MACDVRHVERIVKEMFGILKSTKDKLTSRKITTLKKTQILQNEIDSDKSGKASNEISNNLLQYGVPDSYDDILGQLHNLSADSVMSHYEDMVSRLPGIKVYGVSNNPALDKVMQRVEKMLS